MVKNIETGSRVPEDWDEEKAKAQDASEISGKNISESGKMNRERVMERVKQIDEQIAELQAERKDILEGI